MTNTETNETIDVEEQLKSLILDEDFEELGRMADKEVNLMSILRVEHRELPHSNFLAWLFDPSASHKLGDFFFKEFLMAYFRESDEQSIISTGGNISFFDLVGMDYSDLEVRREYRNIDLLLISRSNAICFAIENKVHAGESKGQLSKYRDVVNTEFSHLDHRIFIFLDLHDREVSEEEQEYQVQMSYSPIKSCIDRALSNTGMMIEANTQFALEQYALTLQTLMNDNPELTALANKVYKKYRGAFDLVFENVPTYQSGRVPHNLIELIEGHPEVRPFHSGKRHIRMQPEFLFKNKERLIERGLMSTTDRIEENWMFLFEFFVTGNQIVFYMKIGTNPVSEYRERLFEILKSDTGIFSKVNRGKGRLNAKWHMAYRKQIISAKQYEDSFEKDDGYLNKIIEEKFNKLVEEELPKMEKVILGEIDKEDA